MLSNLKVRPPAHISPSSFVMKKAGKKEEHKKALGAISVEDVVTAIDKIMRFP